MPKTDLDPGEPNQCGSISATLKKRLVSYSRPATQLTAVIAGKETQRIVVRQTQSAIKKLDHILLLIVYPSGRIPARLYVYNMYCISSF
jgi:hypothetical protein